MEFLGKRILFLGVGGISMFQLALACKDLGATVCGYDAKESDITRRLQGEGILCGKKYCKDFLRVDYCVKTAAIGEDNKFVKEANKRGIPIYDRAQLLGELCTRFECVIAVAGTHGKSTTAALIYEILRVKYKVVSCHIGAQLLDARFHVGDKYLVVEACEYNKSFLSLYPNVSVVTNVEAEHIDSYGSVFNLKNAFLTFFKRGEKCFAYKCVSTRFLAKVGRAQFVDTNKSSLLHPRLQGEYNVKNISLAVAVCGALGVDEEFAIRVANGFEGLSRRDECIGKVNEIPAYIDYAHHSSEVREFVRMFAATHKNPLIIFQPHTYSRTKLLFGAFVKVLGAVNNLCIYKEYPAREKPSAGKSARELYTAVKQVNPSANYMASARALRRALSSPRYENCDAVAFVGAGDIASIAKQLSTK